MGDVTEPTTSVRNDYLLVYEIDDDTERFANEKVIYKLTPGPPWQHFVHFDRITDVARAYHVVMLNGATDARIAHREITTTATAPTELDMAVVDQVLQEERAKARTRRTYRR